LGQDECIIVMLEAVLTSCGNISNDNILILISLLITVLSDVALKHY